MYKFKWRIKMGTWGLGIDENDAYHGVYQRFFDLYNQGGNPIDISKQLQKENSDFLEDETKNSCLFALALAQWETKTLSKALFNKVKKIIETGSDIELLRSEGVDEKELRKRKKELDKFLAKISIAKEKEKPKPRKKSQVKLGNVYAIPLPKRNDEWYEIAKEHGFIATAQTFEKVGKFGFCRYFREGSIAVYQHIGDSIRDLPKSEEYQFFVGVVRSALTCGEWPIVENRPFENDEESWPPPTYIWDDITGKYSLCHKGQIIPSTKAACKGLEETSSWDPYHVIDRIMGNDIWQNFTEESSYIEEYGQEAFDELTKNS